MNHSTPGLLVHHHCPEFTQTHVHRVRHAIQPSHPRYPLFLLPPIPPSIRVFSNESTLRMRWPKYWSFSFSIIPSKEILRLIFRMDWLDLLAVQGTLKSLLQHHSSKASILLLSFLHSPTLYHTSNSHWLPILHMVICMFPCYFLNLSHPLLTHCATAASFSISFLSSSPRI